MNEFYYNNPIEALYIITCLVYLHSVVSKIIEAIVKTVMRKW